MTNQLPLKYCIAILIVLCSLHSSAQYPFDRKESDSLFVKARALAFDGKRDEARKLCETILVQNPVHHEARVLLGRTYAWDGSYAKARDAFQKVLEKDSVNHDALIALTDVELWDRQPQTAIGLASKALGFYPGDKDFLLRRAKAYIETEQYDEALRDIAEIEKKYSDCAECKELRALIAARKYRHTVYAGVATDWFSKAYSPFYYAFIQYGYRYKKGTVIGRVNTAYRFERTGYQPEIDWYPQLGKRMYAYLNYGYTQSSLFPVHRAGAELFKALPLGFEASLGLRYLYFGANNDVYIYTGSLSWYHNNYLFTFRPYITPDNGTVSGAYSLQGRRYFKDADNYISLTLGFGFSPDQRRLLTNYGFESSNNIYFLRSQKAEFFFHKSIKTNLFITGGLDFTYQELSFSHGSFVNVLGMNAGIKKRF